MPGGRRSSAFADYVIGPAWLTSHVRPRGGLRLEFAGLAGDDLGSLIQMSKLARIQLPPVSRCEQVRQLVIDERWDLLDFIEL